MKIKKHLVAKHEGRLITVYSYEDVPHYLYATINGAWLNKDYAVGESSSGFPFTLI